ncbi:MAG: hypothetical protein PHI73_00690 [Patescibacteria group bacterium]|nr:hypothetical protein [Patescibacteria group bacterium]
MSVKRGGTEQSEPTFCQKLSQKRAGRWAETAEWLGAIVALLGGLLLIFTASSWQVGVIVIAATLVFTMIRRRTFYWNAPYVTKWRNLETGNTTVHIHEENPRWGDPQCPWYPYHPPDREECLLQLGMERTVVIEGPILRAYLNGIFCPRRTVLMPPPGDWSQRCGRIRRDGKIVLHDNLGGLTEPLTLEEAFEVLKLTWDVRHRTMALQAALDDFPGIRVWVLAVKWFLGDMASQHNSRIAFRAADMLHHILHVEDKLGSAIGYNVTADELRAKRADIERQCPIAPAIGRWIKGDESEGLAQDTAPTPTS